MRIKAPSLRGRFLAAMTAALVGAGQAVPSAWAHDFFLEGGVSPEAPPPPGGGQPSIHHPSGDDPIVDGATDPVHVDRGDFFLSKQDVLIPGRGPALEFLRSYRSRSGYTGPLGYGWDFTYNRRLRQLWNGAVVLLSGHGRQDTFSWDADTSTYRSPPGLYAELTRNADGNWVLLDARGERQEFDADGKLTAIVDRNRNRLTLTYDPEGRLPIIAPSLFLVSVTIAVIAREFRVRTISDAVGRALAFTYNDNGRISAISDWAGRTWRYAYDAAGNLIQVTAPPTDAAPEGPTTTYGYDDRHNLTSVTDPEGQTYLTNTYDWDDVVIHQTYGDGAATLQYGDGRCRAVGGSGLPGFILRLCRTTTNPTDPLTVRWHVPLERAAHPTDWIGLYKRGVRNSLPVASFRTEGRTTGTATTLGNITSVDVYEARYLPDATYVDVARSNQVDLSSPSAPIVSSTPAVKDRNGFEIHWAFNEAGQILREERLTAGLRAGDPGSFVTTYAYNEAGERIRAVLPGGNGTLWSYDEDTPNPRARGNLLSVIRHPALLGPGDVHPTLVTQFTYEPRFNQIKTATDPRGNVTAYTYDYELPAGDPDYGSAGNLVRITSPTVDGVTPTTRFSYNSFGQITSVTDPNGNRTTYAYDAATGYLTGMIAGAGTPEAATTTLAYDAVGNVTSVTDALSRTTTFEYDAMNQLARTVATAPFRFETRYTYDRNGNVIQVDRQAVSGMPGPRPPPGTTSPTDDWQSIVYTYTILDQLASLTDDLGHTTRFTYDANGNRRTVVDAKGQTTTYTYDERNLLWQVTDAARPSGVTEYAYDANGNLASIRDANGNVTRYGYDGFDRLARTTYANGSSERYSYDTASNLTRRTTPADQVLTYGYDALNRLTTKATPEEGTTYAYDAGSRLTSTTDGDVSLSHTYDALNRVTQVSTDPVPASLPTTTVVSTYDPVGHRTALTAPDGSTLTYAYDALDRLDRIREGATTLAAFTYDALSRRVGLTLANGVRTTSSYDAANRLTQLTHTTSPTPLTLTSTYDPLGNRTILTEPAGSHTYTYDPLSQLTQVDYPAGGAFPDTSFTYDPVGNRLQVTDGGTTPYTPNRLNQYTQVGASPLTYDPNGNLTSDGVQTYAYDSEHRLRTATGPFGVATYAYDPFGRRLRKTVNGLTTRFLYDGDQVVAETDGAGTITATYAYGTGIDEPLRQVRGGVTSYYHADALGSVIALTDPTGTVVERVAYEVYGQPRITDPTGTPRTTSAFGNPFLFTAREYDQETGLYDYRRRYYDPLRGRFVSRDPLGIFFDLNAYRYVGSVGKPLPYFKPVTETNAYLYTGNNPITRIDPLGLWYIDVNISYSWYGAVLTGGVIFSDTGIYSYGGGGGGWPGPGFSLTWSPHNPTPGWNFGAQVGWWGGGQYGTDLAGNPFWEVGFVTPGAAATGYYVQPFQWPWEKGDKNAYGKKKK